MIGFIDGGCVVKDDNDDDDVDDDDDDEPMQAIVEVAEVDRLKSLPDQRLGQSHRHLFKILS